MLISFVIIEYNSLDDVKRCISTIENNIHSSYEIIVSSNSLYSVSEQKKISTSFTNVNFIFNEKNGGFAYAMNKGMENGNGDVLVIMNPDCRINYGIDQMSKFLIHHTNIGAIAPSLVDDMGTIQDSFRDYVSLPALLLRNLKRILLKKEPIHEKSYYQDRIHTVDWVIGAFIMISREAYQLTKGLSDDYFMYAEDLDFCTRLREKGLEVVYYPKAKVQYKGTRSARKSLKYAKIFIKSHLKYWRKFGFFSGYPRRKELIFNDD